MKIKLVWLRVPATLFVLCGTLLSMTPVAAQTTYYVSQSCGSDDCDGQTGE